MANGYVRYGNSIHLDGFQILDFCIENAISLESLRDLNLGRKVFLTGNDTNAGYLRENVWDGTRWRAAAYLDDLTSFKDEDFQQLKEKVDTLIGDGVDMDGIIESWKEVEAFLAGMSDTKNLVTMLDGKLDTKGGTLTGKITIRTPDFGNQLCLDVTNDNLNVIRFQKNGTNMGFLGFNRSDEPIYADKQGHFKILLHEGNVGDYALKNYKNQGAVDYNDVFYNGIQYVSGQSNNTPIKYGILMSTSIGDASWQLIGGRLNEGLYFRGGGKDNTTWGGWKSVAFTDSTVAAAYKLKNPSTNGDVVTITDEGNVLVNHYDLEGVKFAVKGRVHIGDINTGTIALGQAPEYGLTLGIANLGMAQWVSSNGQGNIQVGRFDGTATAYTLNLNPLGGAVNVGGNLAPNANNSLSLGTSNYRWSNVYSTFGDFNGAVTIHSNADGAELLRFDTERPWKFSQIGTGSVAGLYLSPDATSKVFVIAEPDNSKVFVFGVNGSYSYATFNSSLAVANLATFNAGALIPTGQKLTIGDANGDHATIEYDSIAKAIKVDGNLFTTGTLASGGKAKEGTGTGSGSANVRDFELPADEKTTYHCDHLLKSKNVIVQVFEKAIQNNIEVWEMIVADVTIVTEDRVTVTFGRPTTKVHKVHIIGGNVS